MNYFNKIPDINYNGYVVKNLLSRARLSDQTKQTKTLFYPYTLKEEDRPDVLSMYYYDDPGYTWLIWLCNNVIDPYYDLPLSSDDLSKKYDEKAHRRIKMWRNNWPEDVGQIGIDVYEVMGGYERKYWDPVVDQEYRPIAYRRKRHDDVVSTNRVLRVTVADGTRFEIGEEVRTTDPDQYATVVSTDLVSITIQHVIGDVLVGDVLTGQNSAVVQTVSAVQTLVETVAHTESKYWSPVTEYEYAVEQNEAKKDIVLIDARYRSSIEADLERILNQS